MSFRLMGLVPGLALVAMGVAHAQTAPRDTGSMAYPAPRPSGEVQTTLPGVRDTGNMHLPENQNSVGTRQENQTRDTGSAQIAPPSGGYTSMPAPTPMLRRRGMAAATGQMTPAAREMEMQPSTAPVPYTDFGKAAAPMGGPMPMHGYHGYHGHHHYGMMHHTRSMHHSMPQAGAAPAAPAK